ncbi:S-adenosyl-L-methionine-dependent methyltransferase [Rhypophila decipiens]
MGSQTETASSNNRNFWRLADYDENYWTNYLAARPKYNASNFYNILYEYHDAHSGDYGVAHDVGTGPGQAAAVLASRFRHVVASDTNEAHLVAARHHSGSNANNNNIEFLLVPGEDVATKVRPASSDAVYCAEAIPLMDKDKAIDGFAKILKPGGTLGVWFYGRPFFVDGGVDENNSKECNAAYAKVFNTKAEKMLAGSSPEFRAGWKHGTDSIASRLDDVAFPPEVWKDVERRKWNSHKVMEFNDEEAMVGLKIEKRSKVDHEREKVVELRDDGFWAERWDVGQVCDFIAALLPTNHAERDKDPEIQELIQGLEDAMGGKGAKRAIGWPVVLLLATRR